MSPRALPTASAARAGRRAQGLAVHLLDAEQAILVAGAGPALLPLALAGGRDRVPLVSRGRAEVQAVLAGQPLDLTVRRA
jgi:hypothetical protein